MTKRLRRHARRARGAARERSILEQYVDRPSGEPARHQACRSGVSAVAVEASVNTAGWALRALACKLAEPQTVQDGTPALASALLTRPHVQPRLAQKLAPFRPLLERSVEQSGPPSGSSPRDFTTARLSRALMHASAAAGVVEEKVASLDRTTEQARC